MVNKIIYRICSSFMIFIAALSPILLIGCVPNASPESLSHIPTTFPTVTYAPNTGIVKGTILVQKNGSYTPLKNQDLYITKALISPNGITGVAGLDVSHDPDFITDDQGHFAFYNIPPGKYVIILYLVTIAYLLDDPHQNAKLTLLVDVKAGQTTDLGDLKYTQLPVTPQP